MKLTKTHMELPHLGNTAAFHYLCLGKFPFQLKELGYEVCDHLLIIVPLVGALALFAVRF